MKKILKKNQIIVTALALLIAVAGYINYKDILSKKDNVKEANVTVNDEIANDINNEVYNDIENDIISNDVDPDDISITDPGIAILTGNTLVSSDFIISAKLDREQTRALNKDTLLNVIENEELDDISKQAATMQLIHITDVAEREAAAELLLEAKGFTDVIVSIIDDQADVVINKDSLTDIERAQIEDIVKRKAGVDVENVTIFIAK